VSPLNGGGVVPPPLSYNPLEVGGGLEKEIKRGKHFINFRKIFFAVPAEVI